MQARTYVSSLPPCERKDFGKFFTGTSPEAIDLLNQLLCLDPDRRPTAAQALEHPYLEQYHCPDDEVSSPCVAVMEWCLMHIFSFYNVIRNQDSLDTLIFLYTYSQNVVRSMMVVLRLIETLISWDGKVRTACNNYLHQDMCLQNSRCR